MIDLLEWVLGFVIMAFRGLHWEFVELKTGKGMEEVMWYSIVGIDCPLTGCGVCWLQCKVTVSYAVWDIERTVEVHFAVAWHTVNSSVKPRCGAEEEIKMTTAGDSTTRALKSYSLHDTLKGYSRTD